MSAKYPIVAVTGASGSGSSVVVEAFNHILTRADARALRIDGDGFHRYDRAEFRALVEELSAAGRNISHFAPEANHFDRLEALLREYAEQGSGMHRRYLHDENEAELYARPPGTFTEWEPIPEGTELVYYHGLHGCFVSDAVDLASYMDLKIGVVPIVNLEWIRKIHRDTSQRGYSTEAVTDTIMRRMHDYVHYITPQFSRTDINFHRVPTVDTSNPFIARDVPTFAESIVVIRFRDPVKFNIDFPFLLRSVDGSFMSRRNTIVVPGAEFLHAMELILEPLVDDLLERRRRFH